MYIDIEIKSLEISEDMDEDTKLLYKTINEAMCVQADALKKWQVNAPNVFKSPIKFVISVDLNNQVKSECQIFEK